MSEASDQSQKQALENQQELCIAAKGLGKCYQIYAKPKDRLKQAFMRGRKQYYKEFWALRDIDLEVRRGETLAIIGRNGSGKSTLLQMICGTLTATEGSIQTHGTIAALLELGSGFNPEFTGLENVYLNASLFGLSKQQTESRLDDIQAFADIGEFIQQPVKTYSSGMLVRLAFAVIAHVEPSVLIVDEALSVGDAVFGQRCMRFIRRFTEKGTLLFVSHDLNAVSSLCNRAIWINSGRLAMDSQTSSIITAYTKYCLESSKAEINATPKNLSTDAKVKPAPKAFVAAKDNLNVNAQKDLASWTEGQDYGNRHAQIQEVKLLNGTGDQTITPKCGEKVRLSITAHCYEPITNFMAGFIVRNKTGMIIWGENNISQAPVKANPGETITINFEFSMPFLAPSAYSISVAISEGDPDLPSAMHYKPDVFIMEPILGNRHVHGVFAAPDMAILTEVL